MFIKAAIWIKCFNTGKAGTFKVICDGDTVTLGLGHMVPVDFQVSHKHPNEQMGYVLTGAAELTVNGETGVAQAGYMYHLPSSSEYSWRAIGNERFNYVDFFVSGRTNLVNGQFGFKNGRVRTKTK